MVILIIRKDVSDILKGTGIIWENSPNIIS